MSTFMKGSISREANERHLARLKKPVVFERRFSTRADDFGNLNEAQEWLEKRGINWGSMERGNPIGLAVGCEISKWSGLQLFDGRIDDAKGLDGIMVCDESFREGAVKVFLTFKPKDTP